MKKLIYFLILALVSQLSFAAWPLNPNPTVYNNASSFTAFGDSITYGTGASVPANDYVNLLSSRTGLSTDNTGYPGNQCADDGIQVSDVLVTTSFQSTIMTGTNDWRVYIADPNKQAAWNLCHQSLLAYLAIPEVNKIRWNDTGQFYGTQPTITGTWNLSYKDHSISTTVVGATATFNVYGTVAYVNMLLMDGDTSTYNIKIDGNLMGTYSTAAGGGVAIITQNNNNYMPILLRFPGLLEGPHTVVVTVLTVSGTNPAGVFFQWAGGNLGNATKDGPNVFASNIIRASANYYTTNVGYSDALVSAYDTMVRNNVLLLASDGLNVELVDSASVVSPTTDIDMNDGFGGLHPNDAGHAAIASAFQTAFNQIQKPRTANFGIAPNVLVQNDTHVGQTCVAVTVGASPFAYTATFGGDVTISGGTVTSITKTRAGVVVFNSALASADIPVRAGDGITATFSVVPSIDQCSN